MNLIDLSQQGTQAQFAALVGIAQPNVSTMLSSGKLPADAPLGEMLLAYCARLREQAAGRMGESTGLDLVQERAALARAQREGQDIKNAIARREYAPIGLLADVLGMASSAVVDRFDQLEGQLRKACPDLPDEARTTVQTVIAAARNEWIRGTCSLVSDALDDMLAAQADDNDNDNDEEGTNEKRMVPSGA